MTLIAIATYGKHAEFITDSLAYNGSLSRIGYTTKAHILPHLDAAVLAQGDSTFSAIAKATLAGQIETPTFDELVEAAPDLLRDTWHDDPEQWISHIGTVFLVGYSHAEGEFRAYSYSNDQDDFALRPVSAPHVMPAPFTMAPSGIELDRLVVNLRGQVDETYMYSLTEVWPSLAPFTAPKTKADWVALAEECRKQRALDRGRTKTLVGGGVFHTKLARGKASTHEIHRFDDTGDELRLLVHGSLNPASQAGPCPCKSGETYRDCCIPKVLNDSCWCGSEQTVGECCAVDVPLALAKA